MSNHPTRLANPGIIVPIASTFLVLGIETAIWWLVRGFDQSTPVNIVFFLIAGVLAGVLSWAYRRRQRDRSGRLERSLSFEEQNSQLRQRLEGMVKLNQLLIDARTEQELVEKALAIMAQISGAIGCSFVPFDEWGQPLMTYTYGEFPAPVLKAWAEHLSTASVRRRCKVCQKLESKSGEACPLLETPFSDSIRIYCLPLNHKEHLVGMLNLYLPLSSSMSADVYAFTATLLRELVMAVEMLRLRSQELSTMRQLQMANSQEENRELILQRLLEGLCDTLDFPAGRLDFKSALPHFEGLHLVYGNPAWVNHPDVKRLAEEVIAGDRVIPNEEVSLQNLMGDLNTVAAPCRLNENLVIGALVLVKSKGVELDRREISLMIRVAAQAVTLVENTRQQMDREFRAVMQERIRLAREIHDSLAQTLAYLKLNAAQMQSQLANGDLSRLQVNLNQSYVTLSEAYLDTRQAIDNLRINPTQDMGVWIERLLQDFNSVSGLKTIFEGASNLPEISPEIQAQLIRIIQEALNNIRKHAQAGLVQVRLHIWKNDLVLEIIDNGKGFTAEDIPEVSRHGLRGMRERAELIGGDFQIVSQPDQGTTIRLLLPLNIEEAPV